MAIALLEKEANIPPLYLHIKAIAMQRAQKEYNFNVIKYIKVYLNKLWKDPKVPYKKINQHP